MIRILFISLLFLASLYADPPTIAPPALHKGDLIAIVFPAFYIDKAEDKARKIIDQKISWLQEQGYRTILYPSTIKRYGYLAGTDAKRATALMDAWKNKNVKAIWCYRGGFGSECILDDLDYEFIQSHPKIFIGMSDITALHQSIQQKTGLV